MPKAHLLNPPPAGAGLAVCVALVCCTPLPVSAAEAAAAEADDAFRARAEAKAQGLLNDLSSRRRVATLFPNSQSMFQGVQERFVNTSAGNLTFLLRDLVAVGAMPIVAARTYDSAVGKGEDYGPGWRLALREEIARDGSRLAFTDASNAVWQLMIDGKAVKPAHPASTPVRTLWGATPPTPTTAPASSPRTGI